MAPLMVATEIWTALIAAGAALAGSVVTLLTYWVAREIHGDVAVFAAQSAGTLDGIRHGILGLEAAAKDALDAKEVQTRANNVTVYLSESERLLGAARLRLTRKGTGAVNDFIEALRGAEEKLQDAARSPRDADLREKAQNAYDEALEKQDAFGRAAQRSRR